MKFMHLHVGFTQNGLEFLIFKLFAPKIISALPNNAIENYDKTQK